MRCCANKVLVFSVPVGDHGIALERCSHCDAQRWVRGNAEVPREEAFLLLARAFREVPLRAHAARDRAVVATAARRAARLSQRASVAEPVEPAPQVIELRDMLSGWQVLGAAS